NSALAFAHEQGGAAGCATIFPSELIELDLKNEGNPLAGPLAQLLRFGSFAGSSEVHAERSPDHETLARKARTAFPSRNFHAQKRNARPTEVKRASAACRALS